MKQLVRIYSTIVMNTPEKYTLKSVAPSLLRYGLAVVILWFSAQQFLHNSDWVAYVPDGVLRFTGLAASTVVFGNAVFELVFGILLMFGRFTRIAALLLALHLFDIMWMLGYGEIAVRDFGLGIALLSVCLYGPDRLSLDYHIRRAAASARDTEPNTTPLENKSPMQY